MQLECRIESGVPCIYEIFNLKTGGRYVGSTERYRNRFREHRRMLLAGNHHSKNLQRSFSKHGKLAFTMRPLEIVSDPIKLIAREQAWMDATCRKMLYNRSKTAGRAGKKIKPVYSVNPTTGEKIKYRSTVAAALAIHGSRDSLTLINKAIRNYALSGGLFWTRKQQATLEEISSRKPHDRTMRYQQLPFRVFGFHADGSLAGEYRSIADAARSTGSSQAQISAAILSSKYRTAAGLTWSELRIPKAAKSKKTKPVFQIKDGVILQRWESCAEAAAAVVGASYKGISSAATGYTKSHGGFQWVFDKT